MCRRDEAGAALTGWLLITAVAGLILMGLAIDGGYVLAAKRDAARTAEQAARVASDQLSTDSLRTGGSEVNVAAATQAAQQYLAGVGSAGTVSVNADEVTVIVTKNQQTAVLSVIGWNSIRVSGTATAESIEGSGVIG